MELRVRTISFREPLPVPEPEPAHLRPETEEDQAEREATELEEITRPVIISNLKPGRIAISTEKHWNDPIKKWWRGHIQVSVPFKDCRDHLANERTFLAYMRTSTAFSMLGVAVAQLYRLQHSPHPSKFGYYNLGKPLACLFQVASALILILGASRYVRQQTAMARGMALAGGWEISWIMIITTLILLFMFGVHVGIDIYKEL